MKEEQSRREQFTHGNVSTSLPPPVSGKQGSLLLQEQNSEVSLNMGLEPGMNQLSMQAYAIQDSTVIDCFKWQVENKIL